MKHAKIELPGITPVDDLSIWMEHCNNDIFNALNEQAFMYDMTCDMLRRIALVVNEWPNKDQIKVNTNGTVVLIQGPDEFIDNLIECGLAEEPICDCCGEEVEFDVGLDENHNDEGVIEDIDEKD